MTEPHAAHLLELRHDAGLRTAIEPSMHARGVRPGAKSDHARARSSRRRRKEGTGSSNRQPKAYGQVLRRWLAGVRRRSMLRSHPPPYARRCSLSAAMTPLEDVMQPVWLSPDAAPEV